MALKCKCGSREFEPLGIQQRYSNLRDRNDYKVLFLVNCLRCRTTISCSRVEYALMRSHETELAVTMPFYTMA